MIVDIAQISLASAMDAPIAPAWLALALGMITLIVIAGHLIALRSADMPESRRRIRTASGVVIMLATPLVAYALGIVTPAQAKAFTLSWSAVMGLLGLILILAMLDIANNARIYHRQRREMRASLRKAMGGRPTPEQQRLALAIVLAADRIATGRKGKTSDRDSRS
ncbi:MAG: hypothetical protein ACF8R7_08390 [Phycisphaerales bacterium JB039]